MVLKYISEVLKNMPTDWLNLTTHRLDIYNESLAKTEFLEQFENLYKANNSEATTLYNLPTAFDYIRLGHPLSCVLEWTIGNLNNVNSENVISFSSSTTPILAILRKNLFENKNTQIVYSNSLPGCFDADAIKRVYGYQFELLKVDNINDIAKFNGSTIFISDQEAICNFNLAPNIDFFINYNTRVGSIILVNGNKNYISEIQHVRRRETISMTPANCLLALKSLVDNSSLENKSTNVKDDKESVVNEINKITNTTTKALVGSSGLSIQYAILMGLVDNAIENHPNKDIKIVVPPNCYGGTNDQARRVAACLENVEVVDFAVDGDNDMVESIDTVLAAIANQLMQFHTLLQKFLPIQELKFQI